MTNIFRMGADRIAALCFAGMIRFGLPAVASAAVINRGVEGPPLLKFVPPPKSIYPDQQVITAQPSPSQVDPAFLGPVLLMKSAIVDLEAGTATLPLRKGRLESGELVWSIMTDTTDPNLANLHGVDYSPKLAYAVTGKAARVDLQHALEAGQLRHDLLLAAAAREHIGDRRRRRTLPGAIVRRMRQN